MYLLFTDSSVLCIRIMNSDKIIWETKAVHLRPFFKSPGTGMCATMLLCAHCSFASLPTWADIIALSCTTTLLLRACLAIVLTMLNNPIVMQLRC